MSEQKENLERHGADQSKQPLFNIVVCIPYRKIFFKEAPNNPIRYQVNTPASKYRSARHADCRCERTATRFHNVRLKNVVLVKLNVHRRQNIFAFPGARP